MKIMVVGCGGLGEELIRQHIDLGDEVIGCGRSDCANRYDNYRFFSLDVSSDENVREAITAHKDILQGLDVLYYTVAAMQTEDSDEIEQFDADYALNIYNINTLGALRVIKEVLPFVNRNGKIVLISSKNGSMEVTRQFMEYGMEQMFAYNMSKAALNMASVILHEKLKGKGITVLCVHPGSMRTKMSGFAGKNDPSVSASGIIATVKEKADNVFYAYSGERIEW